MTGGSADARLTPREQEVLHLLGEGLMNRQIAERLRLSNRTVDHYVSNILDKLGLPNRVLAAVYATTTQTQGEEQLF